MQLVQSKYVPNTASSSGVWNSSIQKTVVQSLSGIGILWKKVPLQILWLCRGALIEENRADIVQIGLRLSHGIRQGTFFCGIPKDTVNVGKNAVWNLPFITQLYYLYETLKITLH